MEAEGTVFRTNVDVGVDISADELREQFDRDIYPVLTPLAVDLSDRP